MAAIGEILIGEGIITMPQLQEALKYQKANGGRLGDALVTLGFITAFELKQFFNVVPVVPLKAEQTGLSNSILIELILKQAHSEGGTYSLGPMSQSLHLTISVVDEITQIAKNEGLVSIRSAAGFNRSLQIFELTNIGRQRAEEALKQSRYIGPAPVPLKSYNVMSAHQTVRQLEFDREWIRRALSHLVLNDQLLSQLGPAFNSGSSIFLYGPPGLGKSSIADALARAIESHIYIPHAVEVDGQVIRLFDPSVHMPVKIAQEDNQLNNIIVKASHDPRWILCRRPVVVVGGELTLSALDLDFDPVAKFYEAPVHMKATNGVFVLDDFGRQTVQPRQLLNRWIVPMEKSIDFLSLHTGRKFSIPFDQITFFCTNLKPSELVDEALLRRIRHKIRLEYQTEPEFLETLQRVCKHAGMAYDPMAATYLVETYYRQASRPMVGSHPRDLIEQIIDRARFLRVKPELSSITIDAAAANYFVRHE
jgi:predicted ATPase with chaperone activity